MPIDREFLEGMIQACRTNIIKQEAVIAFCEMLIKRVEAEAPVNENK